MVPLSKEIEHMQHVIKINQLRFNNRLNIDFTIQGDVDTISIIPFVLITLVENSFKHGELTDPACPLTLRLSLNNNTGVFVFSTYNRKKTGPRELSHGIGMDNIRKRLQWSYGNDYALKIKDEAEFYTTELTIHSITKHSLALMAPAEDGHYL
jgi:LytS/YehU family sensor histidine kinase